jgi:hypothetical protein
MRPFCHTPAATHIRGSPAWANLAANLSIMENFRPEDVQRIMRELWTEYVTGNPQLFKAAELKRADPGAAGFNWPDANTN